jgi:hypothetical protein
MDELCFLTQQIPLMVVTRRKRMPGADTASFQVLKYAAIVVVPVRKYNSTLHKLGMSLVPSCTNSFQDFAVQIEAINLSGISPCSAKLMLMCYCI